MTKTLIQLGANINYREPSTSRTILDWGLCFVCLILIKKTKLFLYKLFLTTQQK
jgi:hypothetical protein